MKNLQKSQLLDYDNKLKAVILRNCHYSLTVGSNEADATYNFAALEKQLLNEFVYGKPRIINDMCFTEYRKDVYTGDKFNRIEKKVKPTVSIACYCKNYTRLYFCQIVLANDAKKNLMSKLNSICHLREALDQIEILMGFLAAGGEENGNMSLVKYAELLNIHNFSAAVSCIAMIINNFLN